MKYKIKDLPTGKIIWNIKSDILGITGATLPQKYYEYYCIKLDGNDFDYLLVDDKEQE